MVAMHAADGCKVEFYLKPVGDEKVEFVRIASPSGDLTNVQEVTNVHRQRYGRQYAAFQASLAPKKAKTRKRASGKAADKK